MRINTRRVVFGLFLFCGVVQAKTPSVFRLEFEPGRDNPDVLNQHDGYTSSGAFPFGLIGEQSGVCQGIAGISAAFKKNAVFNASVPAPTRWEAEDKIDAIYAFYRAGCSQPVEIGGSANLFEFSQRHRDYVQMRIVDMNLSIAKDQILNILGEFVALQEVTRSKVRVRATLHSLRQALAEGRRPVMLYRSHAVLVYELERRRTADPSVAEYRLVAFDSNPRAAVEHVFPVNAQTDLPLNVPNRGPIWDISPDTPPYTGSCADLVAQYSHVLSPNSFQRIPDRWQPFVIE